MCNVYLKNVQPIYEKCLTCIYIIIFYKWFENVKGNKKLKEKEKRKKRIEKLKKTDENKQRKHT